MPRRGWQQLDVPSGWVRVLRGPRPKSEQWPNAREKKEVTQHTNRWRHNKCSFSTQQGVWKVPPPPEDARSRSKVELVDKRIESCKGLAGRPLGRSHCKGHHREGGLVARNCGERTPFGEVGSTSCRHSNRCSSRCFSGKFAGEDQRSAEGAGCIVGSRHPSFAKPSVDGRWSTFIGQHCFIAQHPCPGRETFVELPQLRDAECSGMWGILALLLVTVVWLHEGTVMLADLSQDNEGGVERARCSVTRNSRYGLRGCRIGEASNPGPPSDRIDQREFVRQSSSPWRRPSK